MKDAALFRCSFNERVFNSLESYKNSKKYKKHLFLIHIRLSIQIKACLFSSDDINVDTI